MSETRAWLKALAGRFVVFDGPDGSGKSTQLQRLVRDAEAAGVEVCLVREPGGTEIGEAIRKVLLDPAVKEAIDPTCEMMLFMASRSQLMAQKIRPALKRGCLVLADRFISSTLAYQGTAGGTPIDDIMRVGRVALGANWPELVVVFDVDEATAAARMNPLLRAGEFDGSGKDRMELKGAAFHRRVRQGYLDQAAADPERYLVIDARGDAEAVYDRLSVGLNTWTQTAVTG
ncbi:MAG: dTMP kinase [Planctomycetota bacterium]